MEVGKKCVRSPNQLPVFCVKVWIIEPKQCSRVLYCNTQHTILLSLTPYHCLNIVSRYECKMMNYPRVSTYNLLKLNYPGVHQYYIVMEQKCHLSNHEFVLALNKCRPAFLESEGGELQNIFAIEHKECRSCGSQLNTNRAEPP